MNIVLDSWISILAFVGGPTVLGGVFMAGVAARWVRPMIRDEINNYEALASTVAAREALASKVVSESVLRTDSDVAKALAAVGEGLREPLSQLVAESTQTLKTLVERLNASTQQADQRQLGLQDALHAKTLAVEALTQEQRKASDRLDRMIQLLEYQMPQVEARESRRSRPPGPPTRGRRAK